MSKRTIAVGDIHGCSLALAAILKAMGPRSDDTIVTLGDYINRGPDSRGVIEALIAVTERCQLIPLLGNHEQKLLDARTGFDSTTWLGMGGSTTLDSYGPGRKLSLIPDVHFEFFETCRDYYETSGHIFAHANYYADVPMDEQPPLMLRWESLAHARPSPHESGKTVIVGHTPQKDGEVLDLGFL